MPSFPPSSDRPFELIIVKCSLQLSVLSEWLETSVGRLSAFIDLHFRAREVKMI